MIQKETVMPRLPGDPQRAACVTGTRCRRVLGARLAHRGAAAGVVSRVLRGPVSSYFLVFPLPRLVHRRHSIFHLESLSKY